MEREWEEHRMKKEKLGWVEAQIWDERVMIRTLKWDLTCAEWFFRLRWTNKLMQHMNLGNGAEECEPQERITRNVEGYQW